MSSNLRNPKLAIPLTLGAVVLVLAAVWLLLISPEQKKADNLKGEMVSTQQQIDQRKAALSTPTANVHVRSSDVFRLNRAMPDQPDMPGVIIVLSRLAVGHHLKFNSIEPSPLVAQPGFNVQPLSLEVEGRFADVSRYLGAVRKLVRVQRHQLAAQGRLFSVESVDLGLAGDKNALSNVKADLTVDAFTFAGAIPVTPTPTPQPTPSAGSGTVAAGANP